MSKHPLYNTWRSMIARCHNPKNPSFQNYGARSITVCERWRASFADFLADVGARPSPRHTLDRKDGSGNYEPANVRWATRREQAENRFDNRFIEYRGERRTLTAWARRFAVHPATLHSRLIEFGWTMDRAVSEPRSRNDQTQRLP